jgi:hypothetical protein
MVYERLKYPALHRKAVQKRSQPNQEPLYPVKSFATIVQMCLACFKGPLAAEEFTSKDTREQEAVQQGIVLTTGPKNE